MLPIKKFFIDSRCKTSSSETHPNFTIELPMTLTGFYIEDVCIPHTWYPINTSNNCLQIKYFVYAPKDIEIHLGNCSGRDLNVVIVAKINAVYNQGEIFVMESDAKANTIGIKIETATPSITFEIYTDSELTDPTKKKAGA